MNIPAVFLESFRFFFLLLALRFVLVVPCLVVFGMGGDFGDCLLFGGCCLVAEAGNISANLTSYCLDINLESFFCKMAQHSPFLLNSFITLYRSLPLCLDLSLFINTASPIEISSLLASVVLTCLALLLTTCSSDRDSSERGFVLLLIYSLLNAISFAVQPLSLILEFIFLVIMAL